MTGRAARGGIAACCALLACAGCGFKGPLYLPERNTTVVTHAAQAARGASSPGQSQAAGTTQPSSTKKQKTSPTPAQSTSSPQSQSPPQSPSLPQSPSSPAPPPQ